MTNEADTCRKFVVPKLQSAGWDSEPHSIAEQRTITDGRVIPVGKGFVRKPPKRVDYLLRYTRDFPLAVVEAKAGYKSATDAVQPRRLQALERNLNGAPSALFFLHALVAVLGSFVRPKGPRKCGGMGCRHT